MAWICKHYGPPLVTIYVMADIGSVLGGWRSSRLLRKRGSRWTGAQAGHAGLRAAVRLPVAGAMYAANLWLAVALIGLACAAHQGFSANLYALPSDLFPRWAVGSVVGLGGFAGALGGMLMARLCRQCAGEHRQLYPIFVFASVAYLLALPWCTSSFRATRPSRHDRDLFAS